MGYDIYRLDKNLNRVERKLTFEQRRALWDKSIFDDPDEDAGADHLGPCYFRRNIRGGSRLTALLEHHGLGYWPDVPPWPELDDRDDDFWELSNSERFAACPQLKEHLTATFSETPGIALHKIGTTNDGWIVTPLEYRSMLGLFDQLPEDDRRGLLDPESAFGPDFYAFATACAASGGSATY